MSIISANEQCQLSAGGFFLFGLSSTAKGNTNLFASARLGGGAAHSIFFIHNVVRGKKEKKDLFFIKRNCS